MNEREVVTKNIRIDAQTRSRLGACIFLAATSTIRAWQERILHPPSPPPSHESRYKMSMMHPAYPERSATPGSLPGYYSRGTAPPVTRPNVQDDYERESA